MIEPNSLIHGDCLEKLKKLPDNSVDAIITDPPYGLSQHSQQDIVEALTAWLGGTEYTHGKSGFMGKSWDSFVPSPEVWKECYRVLKDGGHALVFAGARTQDLMGISLRLAGFEIRETIMWCFASGFPKSHNVEKAIKREGYSDAEAARWAGYGSAVKPAYLGLPLAVAIAVVVNVGIYSVQFAGGRVSILLVLIKYVDCCARSFNFWQINI